MSLFDSSAISKMPDQDLLTVRQASTVASEYTETEVSSSNISYLIQYGRIKKQSQNGSTLISKHELLSYYKSFHKSRKAAWEKKLGQDLNWQLSFEFLREKDTTKHVHRLHPYKGKFIPQLVEYFLNDQTDAFKKKVFFKQGDIVLDPFCGSGTTLVQANELGMHAVGTDVSYFNTQISNVKITKHNTKVLAVELAKISNALHDKTLYSPISAFERELADELNKFNTKYFPTPEFKKNLRKTQQENDYAKTRELEFLPIYRGLIKKHKIKILQAQADSFLEKWLLLPVREEIDFILQRIKLTTNTEIKAMLEIILSRTVRSCRATTHADLATLKEPTATPYYCKKHGKFCRPLFSALRWWRRYSEDALARLEAFSSLRTDTEQICLQGDSRNIDLIKCLSKKKSTLGDLVKSKGVRGIFTSPPYVGLIDYHEQHTYAYDLFDYERNDHIEIGPLSKGQGMEARKTYAKSITEVLLNASKFLVKNFDVFIVANDKYDLYPDIANNADMKIVNRYIRPVLNRTERDKNAYSETIFHLQAK